MSIIDSQMELSAAQAVTSIGTTLSTNIYDVGADYDAGVGEPLNISVEVKTTATSGGSATVAVQLQTSDSAGSGYVQIMEGEPIAVADLVAGKKLLEGPIPAGGKRYFRLGYVVATAALTAGTFNASFQKDSQNNREYPSGFTV